jgi:hypothetical protein
MSFIGSLQRAHATHGACKTLLSRVYLVVAAVCVSFRQQRVGGMAPLQREGMQSVPRVHA